MGSDLPGNFTVSPSSKSIFFLFWGTYIQLGGLLGQGPGLGLGPGLDNILRIAFIFFSNLGNLEAKVQSIISMLPHTSYTWINDHLNFIELLFVT